MSTPAEDIKSLEAGEEAPPRSVERTMIFLVVFLGLLIVTALVAIALRVMYLSSRPAAQPAAAPAAVHAPGSVADKLPLNMRLVLPEGASVRSMALEDGRLAVHYDAPTGSGIAIVDLATGETVARLDLLPQGPSTAP